MSDEVKKMVKKTLKALDDSATQMKKTLKQWKRKITLYVTR